MHPLLVPIVLAAGASSRMGRPKALLSFGDRTALELILDRCAEAGVGRAIVVVGSEADAVVAGTRLDGATVVKNDAWAGGMTTSVQAGVGALPACAEGFFVWPVDLPLVPAAVVGELAVRFAIGRQNGRRPIVVPCGSRRGHPVLFDRAYAGEVLALAPSRPPRDVLERHAGAVEEIPAGESVVRDLDTPGDYAAARGGRA